MTEQELKSLNHNKGGNNYILKGNADNHWVAFSRKILVRLKKSFEDKFNLVVYWINENAQVSYVNIPYNDIKHLLTDEHMTQSQDRWDFIIKQDQLCVHANLNFAISILPYLNRSFDNSATTTSNIDDVYLEGNSVLKLHLQKERNTQMIQKFKQHRMLSDPYLHCEICGFSFCEKYGSIGKSFAEAHHITPISSLTEESETTFADLMIVCSNCHSMLHRNNPPLSPLMLKKYVEELTN